MECGVRYVTLAAALMAAGCASSGTQPKAFIEEKSSVAPVATLVEGAGPVVVAQEVLDGWHFMYEFVTEVEFVLCLEGRREGDKVFIDAFRLARMEASNVSSVRYQPCTSERYIGTAHNHPPVTTARSLCYQSLPDRRSFEADTRAVVDIVLCGDDRFLWVTREHGTQQQGEAVVAVKPIASK